MCRRACMRLHERVGRQVGTGGWVGGRGGGRASSTCSCHFMFVHPLRTCVSSAFRFQRSLFHLVVCCEPTRQEYRSRAAFRHSTVHFSTFTVMRASPCPGNGRLVVGSGGGRCLGNLCLGNHSRVGESNNGKAYVLAIILERESQTMLRPMSWQSF